MDNIFFTIGAFLVAIALLVAVHEFGHFWVARKLGVKVLRFSIGFGKPLLSWRGRVDDTEYVIAAIPLGGYVKMLDEREGPVAVNEAARAFNRQNLRVRSAIVVAGPLFNFLFAIVAFWAVFMIGEIGLRPLIGDVTQDSAAARAGFVQGDEIIAINDRLTPSWSQVVQELAAQSVNDGTIAIEVTDGLQNTRIRQLTSDDIGDLAETRDLLGHIGLTPDKPQVPPVFGKILEGEPAERAGLQPGDRILRVDGAGLADWMDWVKYVQERPNRTIELVVERDGAEQAIAITPVELIVDDKIIGRIGAAAQPVDAAVAGRYRVEYRLPVVEAFGEAVRRTAEYSVLTLKVMWRILTGDASIRNLSGPITIADAAGKTASYGLVYFLKFLAIVSISLGVLNLLPVPVLDGGHLVYFALEAIKGGPLSESFMEQGQKIGLVLLLGLMTLAFYVDLSRYVG